MLKAPTAALKHSWDWSDLTPKKPPLPGTARQLQQSRDGVSPPTVWVKWVSTQQDAGRSAAAEYGPALELPSNPSLPSLVLLKECPAFLQKKKKDSRERHWIYGQKDEWKGWCGRKAEKAILSLAGLVRMAHLALPPASLQLIPARWRWLREQGTARVLHTHCYSHLPAKGRCLWLQPGALASKTEVPRTQNQETPATGLPLLIEKRPLTTAVKSTLKGLGFKTKGRTLMGFCLIITRGMPGKIF